MAIVSYSVPDEIKERFNEIFAGENKSHIIAELMKRAIQEFERRKQRAYAIEALLKLRSKQKPINTEMIQSVRKQRRS